MVIESWKGWTEPMTWINCPITAIGSRIRGSCDFSGILYLDFGSSCLVLTAGICWRCVQSITPVPSSTANIKGQMIRGGRQPTAYGYTVFSAHKLVCLQSYQLVSHFDKAHSQASERLRNLNNMKKGSLSLQMTHYLWISGPSWVYL